MWSMKYAGENKLIHKRMYVGMGGREELGLEWSG